MEYSFSFIAKQFRLCDRDANSVLSWLIRPEAEGGKNIPQSLALEVMFEFAKKIEAGERYGFKPSGISILARKVFEECDMRKREQDAIISTKILQTLLKQPLSDPQFDDFANDVYEVLNGVYENVDTVKDSSSQFDGFADDVYEVLNILYEKVDAIKDRKIRQKRYKQKTSIWHMPFGLLWASRMKPWLDKNVEWK